MTDSAVADHAAPSGSTRRSLLGAGVIGAALAVAGARPVSAGTPTGLSQEDIDQIGFAISLELSARDLYDAAIDAGADDDLWRTLREQHEAYAQLLSGVAGISTKDRPADVFDDRRRAFEAGDPAAAADLESTAAASNIELLGTITDVDAAAGIASIVAMESRHATVLAALAGNGDDLDALFLNTAEPILPEETS